MRAFLHPMMVVMVFGGAAVGGAGCALAGWDGGGGRSFFDGSGPGSAAGAASRAPDRTSGTGDADTGAQPGSSIAPTGVGQDGQRAKTRPHVAVTHMGREPVAVRRPRLADTTARTARHATVAHPHPGPVGTMHALQHHPADEHGHS